MLYLSFATISFYERILTADLENIDESQLRPIKTAGGNRLQLMWYGVIPQALLRMIGLAIYRWDIIRSSTVLGFVGTGGIGLELTALMNAYQWRSVSVILLAILLTVMASEFISAKVKGVVS